jgi:chromosome segregation ATPase
MDPTPLANAHDAPPGCGELIVQGGRHHGASRPLKMPVTLIGQAEGCDIRLNIDGVLPLHCVIALGANGPQLRSWDEQSTQVNDEPSSTRLLSDGDLLQVGPFAFLVRWASGEPMDQEVSQIPEATPVTQPAEVAGPEALLADPQRGLTSEQLDAKQRQLEELHRQLGQTRADFRKERDERQTRLKQEQRDLAEARDEADRWERQAEEEHQRLTQLRRRFLKRWKKHWSVERSRIDRQLATLARDREVFERARIAFEKERAQVAPDQEAHQRQLEESWTRLTEEKHRLQAEQRRHDAELRQQKAALVAQADQLQAREESLRGEQRRAEERIARLRAEAEGLEARAQHGRELLKELEREKAVLGMAPSAMLLTGDSLPAPAQAPPQPPRDGVGVNGHSEQLDRMAAELADQRAALAEQCERLALAREAWRDEEQRMVGELEALTEQLRGREEELLHAEEQLRRERDELNEQRRQLEIAQSRLAAQESSWRGERERAQAEILSARRSAERSEQQLDELAANWAASRAGELNRLRDEHLECAALRRKWSEQMAEFTRRTTDLHEQQRRLAEQALALEEAQQKLVSAARNPALAAKRLERLRRHVQAAFARSEKFLAERRQAIEVEENTIKERVEQANDRIREASRLETELAGRIQEWERQKLSLEQAAADHADVVESWRQQRAIYEEELGRLREEIERLTASSDEQSSSLPFPKAA